MRAPSYADLAATLAVVIALGGTAYAAGLPKDSVRSKQIKNNVVKSADLRDGGVTGADLAADTVTGADVDESSLGAVPDAQQLGGLPSSSYVRAPQTFVGESFEGAPLTASVPGYGSFSIVCDDNNTPAANDDRAGVSLFPGASFAGDPVSSALITSFATSAADGVTDMFVDFYQTTTDKAHRIAVDYTVRSADGSKALKLDARGWDDETTIGCFGQLEVEIVR